MIEKPLLNKLITAEDFKNFYWHTNELKKFCKELGLETHGGKLSICSRILNYIENGIIEKPVTKPAQQKKEILGAVTDQTIIPENILLTSNIREYFEARTESKFRFTKELIEYFRSNPGKVMLEALMFYIEYKKTKPKKESGSTIIPKQCQYNQFIRDYLENNKDNSFGDAVDAWNLIRNTRSDFKYKKNPTTSST